MKFEQLPSLPEENTLPLDIKKLKKQAEHGESSVWEVTTKKGDNIALKQVRKKEFANLEAIHTDRKFYESLKDSPLGKFVPDTLHFIAKETSGSYPQESRVQRFINGRTVDEVSNDEIYNNPVIASQLLELIEAAEGILQTAKKDKTFQPDFRRPLEGRDINAIIGGLISNPRYTKNIIITDKPDEKGRQVFFVDTGVNATERTVKREELLARHLVNPLEKFHFQRWKKKLKKSLKKNV